MTKMIPAECDPSCEDSMCPYTHQATEAEESMPNENTVYSVFTFLVDKQYGGAEEGGWYYETGEPVLEAGLPLPKFTTDVNEADKWCREMQNDLDNTINVGRRDIGSVLSTGIYRAKVSVGMPTSYPVTRPHYE